MPNALDYSPGLDLVTDEVAVMMQDRLVVGLSAWLLDAVAAAEREGRGVQLVTPAGVRLSYPARTRLFSGRNTRWVVQAGEAYDGLTGVKLSWDGKKFAPVTGPDGRGELAAAWTADPERLEVRANLQVLARVRYPALDSTLVGRATELLFTELTGAPPIGWGTEEPVNRPWNAEAGASLTAYCHRRSPRPSLLTVVGAATDGILPATGSAVVNRRPAGIEETVMLAVAQPGLEPPDADKVRDVIGRLAEEVELVTVLVSAAGAAADTTSYPHFTGFPGPIGLAIGPQEARTGTATKSVPIGPASRPAAWYGLGDGTRMPDWERLGDLLRGVIAGTESEG
ncbi:DUF6177 family protein [Kribbella speibonae]|uniref:Uncharacterized protein n=1 Tax=Kribbella speibonae TaxID=1572660 RepID=A0A4V2M313_9ACTN|nr:DUF6177 family protein [Kribbella speibonae]TCC30252.1 hypothetical protein E0H92_40530 [Kribbella speibonae]